MGTEQRLPPNPLDAAPSAAEVSMITLAADYFDHAFANPEWWLKQAELAGDEEEEKVACRAIAARLRAASSRTAGAGRRDNR